MRGHGNTVDINTVNDVVTNLRKIRNTFDPSYQCCIASRHGTHEPRSGGESKEGSVARCSQLTASLLQASEEVCCPPNKVQASGPPAGGCSRAGLWAGLQGGRANFDLVAGAGERPTELLPQTLRGPRRDGPSEDRAASKGLSGEHVPDWWQPLPLGTGHGAACAQGRPCHLPIANGTDFATCFQACSASSTALAPLMRVARP